MKKLITICTVVTMVLAFSGAALAANVAINGFTFDLSQFDGATVTYRTAADGGTVSFDGKLWDNANGVNLYTLGELASGQYGSDPGDQVSLNKLSTPDWLQLNYNTPVQISSASHELVIYEISSSTSGVDTEGLSFKIKLNGGALIDASQGIASFYPNQSGEENTNQIVFDLYNFGFSNGALLSTVYIENKNTGSSTSDPDFIFAGVAVPEPATMSLLGFGALSLIRRKRKA